MSRAAEVRGDIAALDHLLSDSFIGIGPRGFMLTKQEWINRLKSGDLKYEALRLDEETIRTYGDAAIVTARQAQQAKFQDKEVPSGLLRSTLIFTKNQDQWRLAGIHLSEISAPPQRLVR
jgi:ketosteroid isomerase-like protein